MSKFSNGKRESKLITGKTFNHFSKHFHSHFVSYFVFVLFVQRNVCLFNNSIIGTFSFHLRKVSYYWQNLEIRINISVFLFWNCWTEIECSRCCSIFWCRCIKNPFLWTFESHKSIRFKYNWSFDKTQGFCVNRLWIT